MKKRNFYLVILLFVVHLGSGQIHILNQDTTVQLAKDIQQKLRIKYSGCGGFYLENESQGVLIDPYFSNVGPMTLVPTKNLETDSVSIDDYFSNINSNHIQFLLTGHTHIDHVGDYPYILKNILSEHTQLVGNHTLECLLKSDSTLPSAFHSVIQNKDNQWVYSQDSLVRIMPIASQHAPHFLGVKFAPSKSLEKPFDEFPTKSKHFPEGKNYNYLIDFLDEFGSIKTRVFSGAAAAAAAPWGIPDATLIKDHGVDVLLLCGASHHNAKGYPEKLLETVSPDFIIISHWENFFKPWKELREHPEVVPLTNMKKLADKLEEDNSSGLFVFPNVGITIEVLH